MTDIVAICEARNSWIVFESSLMGEDFAKRTFNDLLSSYADREKERVICRFLESVRLKDMAALDELKRGLRPFEIKKYLYNVPRKTLSELFSKFIVDCSEKGLSEIIPFQNTLLNEKQLDRALPGIKNARKSEDRAICEKYLPAAMKLRALHSSQLVQNNIEMLIRRIYLHEKHRFKTSLFDTEGKRLEDLYFDSLNWYRVEVKGSPLQTAITAFGFRSYNAIKFLAFNRINTLRSDLEGRKDWRNIDWELPSLIESRLDLLHLFARLKSKGFDTKDLMQLLPVADHIPGGMYFFESSITDNLKFVLKNFYPGLSYIEVEG